MIINYLNSNRKRPRQHGGGGGLLKEGKKKIKFHTSVAPKFSITAILLPAINMEKLFSQMKQKQFICQKYKEERVKE